MHFRHSLRLGSVVFVLAVSACSSNQIFASTDDDLFDADLAEQRRLSGAAAFDAIDLPDGMEWISNTETLAASPSFSNQQNPLPGKIVGYLTVPQDRPPEVWMNQLDESIRETGVLVGHKFRSYEFEPCDEPFRRTYRHTETRDSFNVLYNPNRFSGPILDIIYTYTASTREGSFEFRDSTTADWDPPACTGLEQSRQD